MSVGEAGRSYDRLAADYDEDFTATLIAGLQREAFWRLLRDVFKECDHVLDLGCGTGEDAVRLARMGCTVDAIDASSVMVEVARERIELECLEDQVAVETQTIERLADLPPERYDGVISNFGPANYVQDLRAPARVLGERVRPGGTVALAVMSRRCLWETLFYPLAALLHRLFRASSNEYEESVDSSTDSIPVSYPLVKVLASAFEPEFELERAPGIGVFLPPTYLEPFAQRFPRMTRFLASVDRVVSDWPVLRSLGDHRVVILRRRGA